MKPQDLRIGNWVYSHEIGENVKITELNEDTLSYGLITWDYPTYYEIHPIQINKEILFKFGAKDFPDGKSLVLNNRLIGYRDCSNVFYDKSTGINLQFVHKLQNLFYELIGEELKASL